MFQFRLANLFVVLCLNTQVVLGWNVFLPDNRQAITSQKYPWRTIGHIANARCTGTLVGKKLVITAAHCVIDPKTKALRTDLTYFEPNYINGQSVHKSWIRHVTWGTNDPDKFRADDWAILELADDLGSIYGWMGVNANYTSQVSLAGYSTDFHQGRTAGVHIGCYIKKEAYDFLLHDCDTTRGSSGGPMFVMEGQIAKIVALNVAEYRDGGEKSLTLPNYEEKHANIAVKTQKFLPKLKALLGE